MQDIRRFEAEFVSTSEVIIAAIVELAAVARRIPDVVEDARDRGPRQGVHNDVESPRSSFPLPQCLCGFYGFMFLTRRRLLPRRLHR